MRIASVLENQNIEKRIAITPEIAKKYISLGFEVMLSENYGKHLGINDEEYKKLGTQISNDEKGILDSANISDMKDIFLPRSYPFTSSSLERHVCSIVNCRSFLMVRQI